jgi:hypothetical protein
MTTIRDRFEGCEEETPVDVRQGTVILFDPLSAGHLPDDDDPAWPSKTGQAD